MSIAKTNTEIASMPVSMLADWLKKSPEPLQEDILIDGEVINIQKSSVFVDLHPYGTGIIYGREFLKSRDIVKNLNPGDKIKAKVLERENEDGYIELSLEEARRAEMWEKAEEAIKSKQLYTLPVKNANKGGLILEWEGIEGFLPASQLTPEHYPQVEGGDKSAILKELKKLIGEEFSVYIISILPEEKRLVFSEKKEDPEAKKKKIAKHSVGDEVEGTIAGIVEFGVFIKIEEGLEGLVHISEMDWGLVEDPKTMFKIGDKVKAKIIEIKDEQISLSIKQLKENPWEEFEDKLKKGDIIKGVVLKYNQHGALVSIKEGVAGLAHVSSFSGEKELREALELGKTYDFQVTHFDPKNQRMTLAYLEDKPTKK